LAKRIIALSIEGTTLRVVGSRGDLVEAWQSVPFNPQFTRNAHVADPEGLGGVIKNAIVNMKLTKGICVCALSAVGSTSRILELPAQLDVAALDTIVQREARRVVGTSLDDSYLYWRALPIKTRQRQVYVLAVPREPLHALMKALETAGLKPRLVELKPMALMRAVNRRDAIVAHGESNSLEMVIVVEDIPALIRGTVLTEGTLSPDYAVGRVSDELVRTIAYYNDSHKDEPLAPELPIYLTGALANSVSFSINVATLTGRPIEPLDPPLSYPKEFPVAEYMTNIGLVIRAL